MSPHISVLIVNYNSTPLLRECLRALLASTCADDLQIIVVDNASEDFPLTALTGEFPDVTWLPQSTNTTCTGGNNLALSAASGETVLMLNPDTRVDSDAISRAAQHLHASRDLVAVGAHLIDSTGELQRHYYRRLPGFRDIPVLLFEPLFRTTRRGRYFLMSDEPFVGETTVEHAAGAFLLIRRDALPGWLLDPGYFNLLSDLELSRYLGKLGRIAVFDDVRCYHVGGGGGMARRDVPARLRFHQDFTWGLRRYFRGHLNPAQRVGLELALAAYWISRTAHVALTGPRWTAQAIVAGWAAMGGRAPRY